MEKNYHDLRILLHKQIESLQSGLVLSLEDQVSISEIIVNLTGAIMNMKFSGAGSEGEGWKEG